MQLFWNIQPSGSVNHRIRTNQLANLHVKKQEDSKHFTAADSVSDMPCKQLSNSILVSTAKNLPKATKRDRLFAAHSFSSMRH